MNLCDRDTAQTCYCGASNCRGVIGGVKNYPSRSLDSKEQDSREVKQRKEKKRKERFSDLIVSSCEDGVVLLK